jgi:hypothetical protein
VNKVPEHLAQLPHIKRLTLYFTNGVELPDWFFNLQIDNLTIYGEIKKVTEDAIWKSFPHARINGKGGVKKQKPAVTDINSFKGIDGNKGVMQEPRWRAIPLDTK